MAFHHVIKLGLLHGICNRTEDKPHDKQGDRRVQGVNQSKATSVRGCAVGIRPRSGPGQLSAPTAASGQAVKDLDSVQRWMEQSLQQQLCFLSGQAQRGQVSGA